MPRITLEQSTIKAKKHLGQHFLHDNVILDRIVACIAPSKQDEIIEIGPGKGALTKPLLSHIKRLNAIELDRDLIPRLEQQFGRQGLIVHQQNVLDFQLKSLLKKEEEIRFRLVGNLPYNISSPILFHFIEQQDLIKDMHFLLQREVVDRIVATEGTKARGRLSIMVQLMCEVEKLFTVAPGAFTPPPKVYSSLVRLVPRQTMPYNLLEQEIFSKIVFNAFSAKRKTIRNGLKNYLTGEEILNLGVDPQQRPEKLSLEQWVILANHLITR